MAYAYYDEAFYIRLCETREEAERRNNGAVVAEVNASKHWAGPLPSAAFTPNDQSYHQLAGLLAREEGQHGA